MAGSERFVVVVTGSRHWMDPEPIRGMLQGLLVKHPDMVVHVGDARGVDAIVRAVCSILGIPHTVHAADWHAHGRAAGPLRNRRMLDAAEPDLVLAFPVEGSKGTLDCMRAAKARGIEVINCSGG